MTIDQAMAEIERKHPGITWAWSDRKANKRLGIPKTMMAYWYHTWFRDEYGSFTIKTMEDDKWQLL